MNSFFIVLLKYLVFISGRRLKQVYAESVYDESVDHKMHADTTAKSTHTTGEYYDYEHDTAPAVTSKTVTTTTEEVKTEYEYEETTISFKDYVTDVFGELVTKRLSRKKKRKKFNPYVKIDENIKGLSTTTTTELTVVTRTYGYLSPVVNRTTFRKRKRISRTDDIETPDPMFHLQYPAGFVVFVYDSEVLWPVSILWNINKNDLSKEISSIRGVFFRNAYLGKWVHDNDEQTFSKRDVFRYVIKYAYKNPKDYIIEHFRRYYTVNISKHYGRYFDMKAAQFRVQREKEFLKNRDIEQHMIGVMELRATPVDIHLPPKVIFIHDFRRNLRKGRSRNVKRMALIHRIDRAKRRLGITESTFLRENVTTQRFRRYFAVGAFKGGFGYLRSQLKHFGFSLTTRSKRYRRFKEQQINMQLANRLGICVRPTSGIKDRGRKGAKLVKMIQRLKKG